jgi:hypothetical protein
MPQLTVKKLSKTQQVRLADVHPLNSSAAAIRWSDVVLWPD